MARKKPTTKEEEILGILLMALGLLVFISLVSYDSFEQPDTLAGLKTQNRLGVLGVYISHFLIQYVLGYPSFVFPVIIFWAGWSVFRGQSLRNSFRALAYLCIFALYTAIILAIPEVTSEEPGRYGTIFSGMVGWLLAKYLFDFLGIAGSIVVLVSLIMITVIGATNISISEFLGNVINTALNIYDSLRDRVHAVREIIAKKMSETPNRKRGKSTDRAVVDDREAYVEPTIHKAGPLPAPRSQFRIDFGPDEDSEPPQPDQGEENESEETVTVVPEGRYQYPALDLLDILDQPEGEISNDELTANAKILENCLLEFGVRGKVVEINPGPVITRYEYEPARGVKISRIVALSDDLALAMRAQRIRIVAPIPGKAAVGIELPNRFPAVVSLREIINSHAFADSDSPLTMIMGKTIAGDPYVTRLEHMPHLLIAGATGAGKSICINTIIASILYKAHPTQVQFVMIDPKRLELSIYSNLRGHHLTYREDLSEEVVTTPNNAISVLKSVEQMMEQRYEILAHAGVRNIAEYNKRLQDGQLVSHDEHEKPYEPLEYIVVIIDELADLMLTAAREVEEPIARLTQMSRAVGIHLIVATQRPSVDVITGVIKANFPARIAFQVASKTDSRTILDLNGAEKLLGRGDMLFVPPGQPEPVRIHGAFVSVEEIEAIIAHIRKQPRYPKHKLPLPREEESDSLRMSGTGDSNDPLFNEALKLIVRHQQGSISLLQRRLKVGYARAARLIDELEAAGIVGPFDGSKAREVLVDETQLEQMDLR